MPAGCGFGVVTVSSHTNFGFVTLDTIAFSFHKLFSKVCLMGIVMPFLKTTFSGIYQSFPLFPKPDQVEKLI